MNKLKELWIKATKEREIEEYPKELRNLYDYTIKQQEILDKIKEEINKELTFEVIVDGEKKEILGYNQFLYKILVLLEEIE